MTPPLDLTGRNMVGSGAADEVVEEDASNGADRVTPGSPPHFGSDFIRSVPPRRAASVQAIDGREDLGAAGRPGLDPVRDPEVKRWSRQSVVSEESGQLNQGVLAGFAANIWREYVAVRVSDQSRGC